MVYISPAQGHAQQEGELLCVSCSYVTGSTRIDHKEDTKLAVDAEEQEALLERMRSGAAASTPSYHFICECFFLTAKGLHLGFVKAVQDLYSIARVSDASRHARALLYCTTSLRGNGR